MGLLEVRTWGRLPHREGWHMHTPAYALNAACVCFEDNALWEHSYTHCALCLP